MLWAVVTAKVIRPALSTYSARSWVPPAPDVVEWKPISSPPRLPDTRNQHSSVNVVGFAMVVLLYAVALPANATAVEPDRPWYVPWSAPGTAAVIAASVNVAA